MSRITIDDISAYHGILAIGDVHSDIRSLEQAANFAIRENLMLLSLGDLVDYGQNPVEVVGLMTELRKDGGGLLAIGNHDYNFVRHLLENRPLSAQAQQTLSLIPEAARDKFLTDLTELVNDRPFSDFVHIMGSFRFCHGGYITKLDDNPYKYRGIAMYGQSTGQLDDEGYPIRKYDWVDDVPGGITAVVGHDRYPLGVYNDKPTMVVGKAGGRVLFMDTACSKGGYLSGAILTGKELTSIEYTKF